MVLCECLCDPLPLHGTSCVTKNRNFHRVTRRGTEIHGENPFIISDKPPVRGFQPGVSEPEGKDPDHFSAPHHRL